MKRIGDRWLDKNKKSVTLVWYLVKIINFLCQLSVYNGELKGVCQAKEKTCFWRAYYRQES